MDRLIYIAMSGAAHTLEQQATVSHNLANAATTGYRSEFNVFRAVPITGVGAPTRASVVSASVGANFAPGPIQRTGRVLDVAVQGPGWIAVQLPDGREAYTRSGDLQISVNGVLQTRSGFNVLGESGPISIPPDADLTIAADGTVSATPGGARTATILTAGRIKLVDPPESLLVKGTDGLFHLRDGSAAPADPRIRLASGALEGSNVNVVEAMVTMIALARQFDMQMRMLANAEENSRQASQILNINR